MPAIEQAAKTNGIASASEIPRTKASTTSASGSAQLSPRRRSAASCGSRSCWIAGCPVTSAVGPAGLRSASRRGVVYAFARCRLRLVTRSPYTAPPAGVERLEPAAGQRAGRALEPLPESRLDGAVGGAGDAEATVTFPPGARRSPWRARHPHGRSRCRARWNDVARCAGRSSDSEAPPTSSASQAARTSRRRRTTKSVPGARVVEKRSGPQNPLACGPLRAVWRSRRAPVSSSRRRPRPEGAAAPSGRELPT